MTKKISMVAALSENYVIADEDGIPWDIPEDYKHYKSTVSDGIVIFGRETFESSSQTGEETIVLSTNEDWSHSDPNVHHARSVEESLHIARDLEPDTIYICGGERVYKAFLNMADEMILSHIEGSYEGTVYFPRFNEDDWNVVNVEERDEFEIKWYEPST